MPDNAISRAASALVSNVAGRLAGPPISASDELLLPGDVKDLLDSALTALGFPLQANNIKDTSRQVRRHYRAPVKEGYMAWLYLRDGLLEDGSNSLYWAWLGGDFANNGALGLFILSDATRVALAFNTLASQWENQLGFRKVKFFDMEFTTNLQQSELDERKTLIKTHIGAAFQALPPAAVNGNYPMQKDRDRLVAILSEEAATATAGEEDYFKDLVARTNWPDRFKRQRAGGYTGAADVDARKLVEYAITQKENPDVQGYTILGGLIEKLCDDVGAGEKKELVDLILKYNLITDEAALTALRA